MKFIRLIALVLFVVFLVSFLIFGIWLILDILGQAYHPNNLVDQCKSYESDGTIPAGSCDCAQRIYPDFSHSYDWMDACLIEKARNGINTNNY